MSGFGTRNETLIPPGMGELDIFDLPKSDFATDERVVVLSRDAAKAPRSTPPAVEPVQATREATPAAEVPPGVAATQNEKVDLLAAAYDDRSLAPHTPSPMSWRPDIPEDFEYGKAAPSIELKAEYVAFGAAFAVVVGIGIVAILTFV